MDFFRTGDEGRAIQEESFRRHIDLAKRLGKPVVIHDRESHEAVIEILESEGAPENVVFHCYSGDADMARYCTERGWYLSFAGPVTFKNAQALRDSVAVAPLDRILVETDAPYLTPTPFRGRPNASYLIPHTARVMAQSADVDEATMSQALWDNAQRVFGAW
jgi:TatD DNase family protein